MKKQIILLLSLVLVSFNLAAQINLVGARANGTSAKIDIVKWQPFDSTSVEGYQTSLEAYYLSSSLFDAWNSNYYLSGLTSDTSGLLEFNSQSNTQNMLPFRQFSNICEIDMSTGKIYTLTVDSADYFSVNEYDILTGNDSVIGVVYEPNTLGIIVDATGFNSNNGILYYVGFDSAGSHCLYSMHVRDPLFSYTKTTLITPGFSSFFGVSFDNANNLLFALNSGFDPSGNPVPARIVEINQLTGAVSTRGLLNGYTGFLMGSSAFDQFSGSYMVAGVDSANNYNLIIFNTGNNTWQTGFLPDGVSEIVCDNYAYAQYAYGTTTTAEKERVNLRVFPNPSGGTFFIETGEQAGAIGYEIIDLAGTVRLQGMIDRAGMPVRTSDLAPGLYLLRVLKNNSWYTEKLSIW